MRAKCPVTCNVYPAEHRVAAVAGCVDRLESCKTPQWIADCNSNAQVRAQCPQSCGICRGPAYYGPAVAARDPYYAPRDPYYGGRYAAPAHAAAVAHQSAARLHAATQAKTEAESIAAQEAREAEEARAAAQASAAEEARIYADSVRAAEERDAAARRAQDRANREAEARRQAEAAAAEAQRKAANARAAAEQLAADEAKVAEHAQAEADIKSRTQAQAEADARYAHYIAGNVGLRARAPYAGRYAPLVVRAECKDLIEDCDSYVRANWCSNQVSLPLLPIFSDLPIQPFTNTITLILSKLSQMLTPCFVSGPGWKKRHDEHQLQKKLWILLNRASS